MLLNLYIFNKNIFKIMNLKKNIKFYCLANDLFKTIFRNKMLNFVY